MKEINIKFENNKVIIELEKKEINHLLKKGILFNPRKDEFKFLDKSENIFIRESKQMITDRDFKEYKK